MPSLADWRAATVAWVPLREPLFRALWIASFASNVGTWMQDVGAAWLMTSLTPSSVLVALVQTATSLPVFVVGLPAAALADVVDRRRLLLFAQAWMLIAATALGAVTLLGLITPLSLLAYTFAIGLGASITLPAWQAITPELVPREQLPSAVALGGVSINLARAIGPALGGLVVSVAGPGPTFMLNALSFAGVIAVLYRWQRAHVESFAPAERAAGAIRAGLRYALHAPALQALLARTLAFILFASALWALLPLVARHELGLGAAGYGALLACLGLGSVVGASALPGARGRLSTNHLVVLAGSTFALVMATLAIVRVVGLLYLAMIVGGLAWIASMASFNVTAQTIAPSWVKARALGAYLFAFQGGLALGSVAWGFLAERIGNSAALLVAAVGLGLGSIVLSGLRLTSSEGVDLGPSLRWPQPVIAVEPELERGPVVVRVEYSVNPQQSADFRKALAELRAIRRRDGAIRWGLFRDVADPSRFVEQFTVESWAAHLRQHQRMTVADRRVEDRVRAYHRGAPPVVTHLIAEPLTDGRR